jgi:sugar (pentulose or hexulose) kinase
VIGLAEEPIHDPLMRLFCNVAAIRGKFIIEAALPAGGAVYRWFADRFFGAASAGEGRFEAVNAEVASSPPGANGVILLPHFKGAGAPHWNPAATGLFFGLGLSTTRGDMARAVLEGVAAEMAENLAVIEEISGRKESLRLSGGLARFPEFARIQADFFGRQVLKAHVSEVTALGAWISAAVRLGLHGSLEEAYAAATAGAEEEVIVPDLSKRAVYLAAAERRKRLYAALEAAGLY